MDFVTSLSNSIDWKRDNYDLIPVIIDLLIKIVYYKLVQIILNAPKLAKIIIYIIIRHYGL